MIELGVVLVLVLLNGVFALSELAVVSARRSRLRAMAEAGRPGARAALGRVDTHLSQRRMAAMVTTARWLRAVFSWRVATRRNCLSLPMQHSTRWRSL